VLFPKKEQAVWFFAAGTPRRPGPERLSGLEASKECRKPRACEGIEKEPIPPEAGNRHRKLIGEKPLLFLMGEKVGAVLGEGGKSDFVEATSEPTANSPGAKAPPSQTQGRQRCSQKFPVLHGRPFFIHRTSVPYFAGPSAQVAKGKKHVCP